MSKRSPIEVRALRTVFDRLAIDAVFDIGANRGQYYDLLRTHVGYLGPVVSVEPLPDMAASLERKMESDAGLYVERLAVCEPSASGKVTLNRMSNSQFSSLLQPSAAATEMFAAANSIETSLSVDALSLTDLVLRYRNHLGFRRAFLKMDTQGYDVRVVQSGLSVITDIVAIQSELNVTPIYAGGTSFTEALYFYRGLGFELYSMFPTNEDHFPHLVDLDAILVNSRYLQSGPTS
jgi:FkbM family methyltransferase